MHNRSDELIKCYISDNPGFLAPEENYHVLLIDKKENPALQPVEYYASCLISFFPGGEEILTPELCYQHTPIYDANSLIKQDMPALFTMEQFDEFCASFGILSPNLKSILNNFDEDTYDEDETLPQMINLFKKNQHIPQLNNMCIKFLSPYNQYNENYYIPYIALLNELINNQLYLFNKDDIEYFITQSTPETLQMLFKAYQNMPAMFLNELGLNELHMAALMNDINKVMELCNNETFVNQQSAYGTPFFIATALGHTELAFILMQYSSDSDQINAMIQNICWDEDTEGREKDTEARRDSTKKITDTLLNKFKHIDDSYISKVYFPGRFPELKKQIHSITPLKYALIHEAPEAFKLIYQRTPKHARNNYFIEVAKMNWIEILEIMLNDNADIRMKDIHNGEVLDITLNCQLSEITESYREYTNSNYILANYYSNDAIERFYKTIKFLLENGAASACSREYHEIDLFENSLVALCFSSLAYYLDKSENHNEHDFSDIHFRLIALLLNYNAPYGQNLLNEAVQNKSSTLLKHLLRFGQGGALQFNRTNTPMAVTNSEFLFNCSMQYQSLYDATYPIDTTSDKNQKLFTTFVETIKKCILNADYFAYYINQPHLFNGYNSGTPTETNAALPIIHRLILGYTMLSQGSNERTAYLEIFKLIADKNICHIRLDIKDANNNSAIDLIEQKNLTELKEIFLSPAEIMLRDLLIHSHPYQIQNMQTTIELAKAGKLLVTDKEFTFPLQCQYTASIANNASLLNSFNTNGIDIKVIDQASGEVNITVSFNENTVIHLLQNWTELTNYARPPFTNTLLLDDTKDILNNIERSAHKSQGNPFGIPYAAVSSKNIAQVFFSIVRATLYTRSKLLQVNAMPTKKRGADDNGAERMSIKKPKLSQFFNAAANNEAEVKENYSQGMKM